MVILTFYFIYTNHISIYLFFEAVSSLCFNDYRNRHRGRRQQNFASNYLYIVMKKALSVICYFRSSILCDVNFEILFKKKDKNIFCKAAPLPYHANIKICCVTDRQDISTNGRHDKNVDLAGRRRQIYVLRSDCNIWMSQYVIRITNDKYLILQYA